MSFLVPLLVNSLNKTIDIKKEERNETVKLAGILINLYDKRINIHKQGIRRIDRLLEFFITQKIVNNDAVLFKSMVRNLVDVKKASGNHLPVCIDKPRSDSTMEFIEVCKEILDQIS